MIHLIIVSKHFVWNIGPLDSPFSNAAQLWVWHVISSMSYSIGVRWANLIQTQTRLGI